ncbi:MAG: PorP/SprF family type IX secretion system membrane protein [Bacteroidetes bacterium]|nr:PorP/SprF family type IX secretion system membrane protein [Bacteroidota bacterium]
MITQLTPAILKWIPSRCSVLLVFAFIYFIPSRLTGQDIHYSQFEASPLNLNPAFTGLFNGDLRFVANHRRQWKSVTTPYSTFSGSFDMALGGLSSEKNRYSGGLLINKDQAGDSELGLFQAALSFSMIRSLDQESKHFLGAGIQIGYSQRSINYSTLTFDEQYTGDSFDPNAGNTENFAGENHGYGDVGAGIAWMMRASERAKVGAGISFQHINRPDDSFLGAKVKMFPRLQADLKADFAVAERFDLVPAVIFMNQGSFKELTGGTSVRYRFSEMPGRKYAFLLGGWLRKSDAFIASAGVDYNNLGVGVSYDFNTSDLDRASNGRGGYELSLIYIITKVKPLGIKPPCPLY